MSKICLFFATRDDLLAVTERVESAVSVKYARFGTVTNLPPENFNSAAQIPNLGKASHPSADACESFLVCDPQTTIKPRQLKTLTEQDVNRPTISIGGQEIAMDRRNLRSVVGLDRFAIDQLDNPDTIVFTPGGIWNDDILLHGRIGTASESKMSQEWMKRFGAAIASKFTTIKAFYVGPQALVLLKSGKRLTISAQSPKEFDLSIS